MKTVEQATRFSSEADLQLALATVERKLEFASAIENPLERFRIQEQLEELRETLQAAIDEAAAS